MTRSFPKLSLWVDSFGAVLCNRRNQVLPPNFMVSDPSHHSTRATRRNLWESDSTPCPDPSLPWANSAQMTSFFGPFFETQISSFQAWASPANRGSECWLTGDTVKRRRNGSATYNRRRGAVEPWSVGMLAFQTRMCWFLLILAWWNCMIEHFGEFQRYHWYNCVPFRANGCFSAQFPRQVGGMSCFYSILCFRTWMRTRIL